MPIHKTVTKLILLFWGVFMVSAIIQCNKSELTSNDRDIIASIIDKTARPLPPPPKQGTNDTIMSNKLIDSLKNVKLRVGIHPLMKVDIEKSGLKKTPVEFKSLVNGSLKSKYLYSLNGLKSNKGNIPIVADTLTLKNTCDFENFDLLFNFSRIWYDKTEKKAILEVGVSRSCMAGFSTIFCLEKKKNQWSIVKSIPTSIW